jgi:hypothetical protein
MMRPVPLLFVACLVIGSPSADVVRGEQISGSPAQSAAAAPAPRLPAAARVDIVLSRFQGEKAEKKVSSLPYTLYVREGRSTQLTLGNNVPIPSKDGYNYQNVGVQIMCMLEPTGDGRYWLMINFTDSSVAETAAQSSLVGAPPVIRSISLQNTLTLRDGQTLQFGSAVDKITGDTLRADVTLTIVK